MTVLARMLAPDAYGLMALAAIVTNLAYLFRDMGTGAALIQAATVSPRMAATVHWSNVGLGIAIGAVVALSAPLMAHVFHEPQLASVLCLLALVFPVTALGVVHQALLERESKFQAVGKRRDRGRPGRSGRGAAAGLARRGRVQPGGANDRRHRRFDLGDRAAFGLQAGAPLGPGRIQVDCRLQRQSVPVQRGAVCGAQCRQHGGGPPARQRCAGRVLDGLPPDAVPAAEHDLRRFARAVPPS
ncbi:oligosaccharide flippase family protein [Massilia sp. H-1]|nr:oligosaccharide flippase family protein [Massilia sp. H-1]